MGKCRLQDSLQIRISQDSPLASHHPQILVSRQPKIPASPLPKQTILASPHRKATISASPHLKQKMPAQASHHPKNSYCRLKRLLVSYHQINLLASDQINIQETYLQTINKLFLPNCNRRKTHNNCSP